MGRATSMPTTPPTSSPTCSACPTPCKGRRYYRPTDQGSEARAAARLQAIRDWKEQRRRALAKKQPSGEKK